MPSYRYTALAPAGGVAQGVIEADSEESAVARLRLTGHTPMRVAAASSGGIFARLGAIQLRRTDRLNRQEVTNLTRELAIMLSAGQDLDRALRFLLEAAPNSRIRSVIATLRDTVRDGSALAPALAQNPGSFPKLYIALVRAGESGGHLADTLEHLASLMERQRSLASSVTSAMIYPALLIVAAVGAITLLLTQVLPQFVPLFEQSGAALPPSTQFVIDAGAFVSNDGLQILAVLLATVLLGRQLLRNPGPRLIADRVILILPVIGPLNREIIAARFTRTFGTLLQNGVSLMSALGIVRDVVGNLAAVAAVEAAIHAARGGGSLARALGETAVFPLRTIHLLRLGDEAAQLGPMANRAAEIHEEKARLGIQRLVSLLVPAITIVMGVAVAGIVSALLLAMLSLNDLAAG